MFEHEAWYQGEIVAVDLIRSEKKQTPALEVTVKVSDRGEIVGHWWLTNSMVSDPRDKTRQVPQTEAAKIRCQQFGCEAVKLDSSTWLEHIRETLVTQTAAVCAEVNDYGDTSAKIICKPKGKAKGYKKQAAAPSPFGAMEVDQLGVDDLSCGKEGVIDDSDVPF